MTPTAGPITQELEPQTDESPVTPELTAEERYQQLQAKYGERLEKLPRQLVDALRGLVLEFNQQDQFARRREGMRDRKNRFYERSVQHLYETRNGFASIPPGMTYTASSGAKLQAPRYVDNYNIYLPGGRVIDAVLTQSPPGIEFRPDEEDSVEDKEAAEAAQESTLVYDRSNDIKGLQLEQVRYFRLSGRTVSWTRTEADAQFFGRNDDGTAKRREKTTFHGTLETKVPITARTQADCLYAFIFDDPDVKEAKSIYKGTDAEGQDIAKLIQAGTATPGESDWQRIARLGILQGTRAVASTGDVFDHLAARVHAWLRPNAFTEGVFEEPYDQEAESAEPVTVGDALREMFPEGVRVIFVGTTYVAGKPESMDDHLDIAFPYKGDGMSRQAIMDSFVVIQDTFNDVTNAVRQAIDTGWPSRYVNADDDDAEAFGSQMAVPYAYRGRKARSGQALAQEFHQDPDINIPQTVMSWLDQMTGPLAQYMLATPPALFGQGDKNSETASGQAQLAAQARGQLSLFWSAMQRQWARIRYQAALCAAKNPDYQEQVLVPGADPQTSRFRAITKGHFGAFPDEESSFPESTDQKRAVLQGIIEIAMKSPQIGMQILGSPKNWKTILTYNGIPELEVPNADAWEKQEYEIEELLKAPPTVSPEAMMAAQQQYIQTQTAALVAAQQAGNTPSPVMPFNPASVQPDQPTIPVEFLDYHAWEFECCREWLAGQDCRDQLAEGNFAGVENVRLHALAHLKLMAVAPPVPGQVPAGPPPGALPPSPNAGLPPKAPAAPPAPVVGQRPDMAGVPAAPVGGNG
jgi:hypothetical protein